MGSVFLNTSIDDYIHPSQSCINPLYNSSSPSNNSNKKDESSNESFQKRSSHETSDKHMSNDSDSWDKSNGSVPSSQHVPLHLATRQNRPVIKRPPSTHSRRNVARIQIVDEAKVHTNTGSVASVANIPDGGNSSTATKATVSVADCLACSGCVTSAETVLVEQHSIKTLRDKIDSIKNSIDGSIHAESTAIPENYNQKMIDTMVVFTISPATLVDLARVLYGVTDSSGRDNVSIMNMYQKLTTFLNREFNATFLLDGRIPQCLSLMESAIEFCDRFRSFQNESQERLGKCKQTSFESVHPKFDFSVPSIALSATETRYIPDNPKNSKKVMDVETVVQPVGIDERHSFIPNNTTKHINNNHIMPMLSSSCPGFVCYIEKTVPSLVPNLCTVKSSMAIAGALYKKKDLSNLDQLQHQNKNHLSNESLIYHVAIMPCHDKKLEASRKDLAWRPADYDHHKENNDNLILDVDLVITTNELLQVLQETSQRKLQMNDGGTSTSTSMHSSTSTTPINMEDVKCYLNNLPPSPVCKNESEFPWSKLNNHKDRISDSKASCTQLGSHATFLSLPSNRKEEKTQLLEEEYQTLSTPTSSPSQYISQSGSGGYAEYIFRYAAKELFGHILPASQPLPWKPLSRKQSRRSRSTGNHRIAKQRSHSDFYEVSLYYHPYNKTYSCNSSHDGMKEEDGKDNRYQDEERKGKEVLKFATAYGFKNIQLIMNQLSSREKHSFNSSRMNSNQQAPYHFIEMMACPSGCLNGGGQIQQGRGVVMNESLDGKIDLMQRKETPSDVRSRMQSNQTLMDYLWDGSDKSDTNSTQIASSFMFSPSSLPPSLGYLQDIKQILHTRFHVVPKLELSIGSTAGVAVEETHW